MDNETELIALIDQHLAASGEAPSTFGTRACGDPKLMQTLRNGRSPALRTVRRILAAIPGAGALTIHPESN